MLSNVTKYTNSEILIFQNTLLKYKRREHGDSKMKDLTTKGLGAASGISKLFNIGKTAKARNQESIGNIQMTGVYAKSTYTASVPKSTVNVPQNIVDKYADVVLPNKKPTQLVIADADYIPDKEFADVES